MIRLDGVTKTFPGTDAPAVDRLSLSIDEGETVVLIGPSGCGKTTTLKMINRLIEPTSGVIEVAGIDVTTEPAHELRRRIGYVIQQVGLLPHRTVAQNVATVPRLLGWDKPKIDDRVEELIEVVGLEASMRDRYPAELSGGQQQRVGVARALAADPPVLLMDEPFGAVDPIVRANLQQELRALQARLGKTIVLVTHDIDEAIILGDRIAILNVGGILEQFDAPGEILTRPANSFVESILGRDRGIKRLSLLPIAGVDLEPGPVVAPGASAQDARSVMEHYGTDWFGIADGETMVGWHWASDLTDAVVPTTGARSFSSQLRRGDSLRDALDVIVTSHTRAAPVFDGDRYVGMLTAESIAAELAR
jgi:osmoprotectant transport system ATP-binding protein